MRVKNSLNNIITGLMGQVIILITGFVSRTVFIKMLGSTYLGVSSLFSNVLTVLSFAELGIGQAIIFSLYKPIADKDEDKICSLMQLYARVYRVLFFIVMILGIALLPFLKYIIKDIDSIPNIRIIYVMYIINSASSYLFAYKGTFITACQKNYVLTLINNVSTVIMTILQVIFLFVLKNYLVYLGIQISFSIINNIISYIVANKMFPFLRKKKVEKLKRVEINKIKNDVKALILYKIGSLALNSTDNIIISSFVGIVSVGMYSNYLLISNSVTAFISTIFSNLTASIGNLNAEGDDEKKYFIFKVINLATFWFYAACAICLYICITPFIHIWIGDEYVLSNSVVLIICINIYISGMLYAPFNYRQTMGLFVQGKYRPIISAIINIVVSIILAKYFGLAGVLWGTAIARLTTNVWFDPYLVFKKGLKMSPLIYIKDYIIKIIILILIGGLCIFVTNWLPDNNLVLLMAKGALAFILCNISFLFIYHRTDEFKYLFNVVKQMKKIYIKK